MITIREMIILSAITIVKCQYDYYRPDIQANELGYNIFGQPFSPDDIIRGNEIPGKSGTDYPIFSEVPETGFRCDQQRFPGYYADTGTGCQAFHICQRGGRGNSFLCPNGTIFNQEWLVCDWWYNSDCSRAESFYSVNEEVVRSMQEADTRLKNNRYNDLRRFGNSLANGESDYQNFRNFQNGFTPLENKNGVSSIEYGVPGAPGFEGSAERLKYNRGGSSFGRFSQRNVAPILSDLFGVTGARGYERANIGYQRNIFRGDNTLDRNYLPQGK